MRIRVRASNTLRHGAWLAIANSGERTAAPVYIRMVALTLQPFIQYLFGIELITIVVWAIEASKQASDRQGGTKPWRSKYSLSKAEN
jgi:hypothetical protein